jgi:nucleoside-diphosphate-sugar epimerase
VDIEGSIISSDEQVLVTGASGFIGAAVVRSLLDHGLRRIRCAARPSSEVSRLKGIAAHGTGAHVEVCRGNLLVPGDCREFVRDVSVVYHLAAGTGIKSFPDAFANSVVTTRNLLDASVREKTVRRFVSMSSFTVYANRNKPGGRLLDESCGVDEEPRLRGDAYCYAKVKQDQLVLRYARENGIRYVLVRPGVVYGPGKNAITGRVGIGTFGIFLHLGGFNRIPFTYVDNCADAIVLAGLKRGAENQVINIVDDELPSSWRFLHGYKTNVRRFHSLYLPGFASYLLCWMWEAYSRRSQGQLPPVYNRRTWHAYWKYTRYTNEKAKRLLGWRPSVRTAEGLQRYYQACRGAQATD